MPAGSAAAAKGRSSSGASDKVHETEMAALEAAVRAKRREVARLKEDALRRELLGLEEEVRAYARACV